MSNMANVRSSLARIINLHVDFPAMMREANCDTSGSVVLEQLENHASRLGVGVSHAAKSVVSTQIKGVAELAKSGQEYERDLQGILTTTRQLMKKGILYETDLGEQLLCDPTFLSLPLTALWRFKCIGIVSLEQIIKSIHDGKGGSFAAILDDVMEIILHKGQEPDNIIIASDILAALVDLSYNLDNENYASLSKCSNELLYSVTKCLLDYILDENSQKGVTKSILESTSKEQGNIGNAKMECLSAGDNSNLCVLNIYVLLMNNLKVNLQALQKYCSSQLVYLLTHRPNLHVANVLKSQEKWRSTNANPMLSSLMQKLVIVIGYETALKQLNIVMTNEEVNWCCVLTLVATTVNCHKSAVTMLKSIIERHIRKGCEEQDMESLVIGFIFARHASQEGRHLFPSYSQWFNALFATEAGSPAANKQSFVFLVQFLTDLVPHEPAYCLRAHLTYQIFIPKGCQEVLRDYFNLARTRSQDLNENNDGNMNSQRNLVDKDKVMKEVEQCIELFCQNGKVPNFILEASIFRKPYYLSSFLPVLLMPRTLPDEPDALCKLIELLHSSGKIPPSMYKNYSDSCQKVASDLLSGVFINTEEEIVIEEPIKELSYILQDLVKTSSVLPVLSRISRKIEEIMKSYDSKMTQCKYLTLNSKMYNSRLTAYQVIEEIVNTLVRVCLIENEDDLPINRPDWLPQFLSLITTSPTLQLSLYNYLLHNLERGQQGILSPTQTQVQGALMSEICSIEGLYLPVTESTDGRCNPSAFTCLYLNKLERETSTKRACMHSCALTSNWLTWHMMSCKNNGGIALLSTLPSQLTTLYCLLAPRVSLIREAGDEEVSMGRIYSLLKGYHVADCAKLYYNQIYKSEWKDKWVSLEKWIVFELHATWQETPLDVILSYLQCRIQQDFIKTESAPSQDCTKDSFSEIILNIVFSLVEVGVNQNNYREMLMFLQRLSQITPDADICLLEEWHREFGKKAVSDARVMSFMSICRCLPSSYFLPPKKLLQLSGPLEHLVKLLKKSGLTLELNLCETSFFCSCLLNAAKDPNVKDFHIEKCLKPIRMALLFHSDSIKILFENNVHVVQMHFCLKSFHLALNDPIQNNSSLTSMEMGISLLSVCLKSSFGNNKSECPQQCRREYIKWLMVYIGLQQARGFIPFFPGERDICLTIKDQDLKVIQACRKELEEFLMVTDSAVFAIEMSISQKEASLALRMFPTACAYIVLCEFALSRKTAIDYKSRLMKIKLFDLLLNCHIYQSYAFDSKENVDNNEQLSHRESSSANKDSASTTHIGYISELYKKIFYILPGLPSKMLCELSQNTLSRCDLEIQAAIKYRLQGCGS